MAEGFRLRTLALNLEPPKNPTTWTTWEWVLYVLKYSQASDRYSWRSSVRIASSELEAERYKAAKEKRRSQKERAASLSSSSQTFVCPRCGRGCASRIGLYSHQRACKNWPSTFPTIHVCEEWAIIIRFCFHIWEFSPEKFGSFSPRKASWDRAALPSLYDS